jgi:YebC/PmpR family DNA-binding regulatory protein
VALLIEVLTDNKNRCVAEIRNLLTKSGGKMAEPNSVAWMFSTRGQVSVEALASAEDALMEVALEAGAEDIEGHDEGFEVFTTPDSVDEVKEAVEKGGFKVTSAKVVKVASTTVKLDEKKRAEQMLRLMEVLDDNDDVRNVWANFDISDEVMATLD